VVSIVFCDVAVIDEVVGLAVIVLDVWIALTDTVSV